MHLCAYRYVHQIHLLVLFMLVDKVKISNFSTIRFSMLQVQVFSKLALYLNVYAATTACFVRI